jgi:hypothetical protein
LRIVIELDAGSATVGVKRSAEIEIVGEVAGIRDGDGFVGRRAEIAGASGDAF